jgi:hypothetical protein
MDGESADLDTASEQKTRIAEHATMAFMFPSFKLRSLRVNNYGRWKKRIDLNGERIDRLKGASKYSKTRSVIANEVKHHD